MKKITLSIITFLYFSLFGYATDTEGDKLQIETDGYFITVVDFNDGDEIRLFEAETGTHILSKTRGFIDLSQLPNGIYVLENTNGKSTTIERTEITLRIAPPLGTAYVVTEETTKELTAGQDFAEELKLLENRNVIDIKQEGNIVTVVDFKEGDAIKLFEIKDAVHVLTKTTGIIDLTLLEVGRYFIENKNGDIALIEKFAREQDQKIQKASYLYVSK